MAVIEDLPGLEVTVQVDGAALKEYQNDDEQEKRGTMVRYIEAVAGKRFSVKVTVNSEFKWKGDSITLWLWADGSRASGAYRKKDSDKGWECQGFDVGQSIKLFQFEALDIAPDGSSRGQKDLKVKELGNLTLKVHHTKLKDPSGPYNPNEIHAEVGTVSEKALKGQALSHKIGHAGVIPRRPSNGVNLTYIGGYSRPAATFTFRYRSLEALKGLLIIPRTPSSQALEDKDPADLTADDIKELQRRAKEAKGAHKTEPKIKREQVDDNPRPRKVSRPKAGDTQLELDDEGNLREASAATADQEEQEAIMLD